MQRKIGTRIYLIIILGMTIFIIASCNKSDDEDNNNNPLSNTVTDIDGNVYHTVTIGTQVWMVENLKTTKYRDGTDIPNITDPIQWNNLTTGAYCDYENTPSNSATYGKLYNWFAVTDVRNIAPLGWHVPTEAEWETLITYLGGNNVAGGKLKEIGTTHWNSPNEGATNESGFFALPSGIRTNDGNIYLYLGMFTYFWSTSEVNSTHVRSPKLEYDSDGINIEISLKNFANSIRCIKD